MDFEDDYVRPSKSAQKREAMEKHDLGKKLVAYPKAVLNKLTLDNDLREALLQAQAMHAHGAKRRQLQLIAKKLRTADIETIEGEIQRLELGLSLNTEPEEPKVDTIQPWIDRLQEDADSVIAELLDQGVSADRQRLRQLSRNYAKSPKPDSKASKALRQYLSELGL